MKKYEERVRPAKTERVVVETLCDICGLNVRRAKGGNQDEVTMKKRLGDSYPEGGNGTEDEYDVCVECWDTKIVPYMRTTFGIEPQSSEWDW